MENLVKRQQAMIKDVRENVDRSTLHQADLQIKLKEKGRLLVNLRKIIDDRTKGVFELPKLSDISKSTDKVCTLLKEMNIDDSQMTSEADHDVLVPSFLKTAEVVRLKHRLKEQENSFRAAKRKHEEELWEERKKRKYLLSNMQRISSKNRQLKQDMSMMRREFNTFYKRKHEDRQLEENYRRLANEYVQETRRTLGYGEALAELHFLIEVGFEEVDEETKSKLDGANLQLFAAVKNHQKNVSDLRINSDYLDSKSLCLQNILDEKTKECRKLTELCEELTKKLKSP